MIFDDLKKPLDYRFLVINGSFEKQTGLIDAVGKRMREFAPNHEDFWFETYGKVALTGESIRFQNRAEQLHRWYDVYAFRFGEPKNFQVAILFNDITERIQAEETIKSLNIELAQSLEREKELNEMKSRFVSIASHEFRTPLSAILSSISLIDSYGTDEQKDKRDKHISRVRTSVKDLVDILNDFLSVDKLEQGKVEVSNETFDLSDFASDIIEEVNVLLKQGQQITFSHKGEKEVSHDKKILKNVFLNLLPNAIKYSREYKEIFFLIEVSNKSVSIRVKDQGIGIPEEEHKHLFNKFFRAKNVANIQGTGLGLNIVKKYVELLDGTISFESKLNQGTTFTIQFPRNSCERQGPRGANSHLLPEIGGTKSQSFTKFSQKHFATK